MLPASPPLSRPRVLAISPVSSNLPFMAYNVCRSSCGCPMVLSFPRCVLSGSCPQLLDATLRTIQTPVDQERVGIGRYLRRDPGSQPDERGGQSLAQAEDPLEARDGDLYVLPRPVAPFRALGSQEDADLCQGLPQILASVSQVSQELPRRFVSQSRLG